MHLSFCAVAAMSDDTFTVIILYQGQKYGLIMPQSATIDDLKGEICVTVVALVRRVGTPLR